MMKTPVVTQQLWSIHLICNTALNWDCDKCLLFKCLLSLVWERSRARRKSGLVQLKSFYLLGQTTRQLSVNHVHTLFLNCVVLVGLCDANYLPVNMLPGPPCFCSSPVLAASSNQALTFFWNAVNRRLNMLIPAAFQEDFLLNPLTWILPGFTGVQDEIIQLWKWT